MNSTNVNDVSVDEFFEYLTVSVETPQEKTIRELKSSLLRAQRRSIECSKVIKRLQSNNGKLKKRLHRSQQKCNNLEVTVDELEGRINDHESAAAHVEAQAIMTNGCSSLHAFIPNNCNATEFRSLAALKAAAMLDDRCLERLNLRHERGSLSCKQEQEITGDESVGGGKTHLQYYAIKYEEAGLEGVYVNKENYNKTQKIYMSRYPNKKCLISLNKVTKTGELGKKQGGVWKYKLRPGEIQEDFYARIIELTSKS